MVWSRNLLAAALVSFSFVSFAPAKEYVVASPESQGMSSERLKRISAWMKQETNDAKIPGGVVMVARNGKIVYREVVGQSDKEKGVNMREDAIFRIASMTKPIVSVAAMMMVEQGRLRLSDPVSQYLPELKDLKVARDPTFKSSQETDPARPITIQDLLRHSSGFTYWFVGPKNPIQARYQDEGIDGLYNMDAAEMLKKLADIPLLNQPGTTYNYSVSTDVLGHVLERIAGKGLDEVLQEMVLKPLDMRDTGFWVHADKRSRIAQPAANDPEMWIFNWIDLAKQPKRFSGGAGMVSTARDYMRFCLMLANGGELDGVRLLSPHTVKYMMSDHLGIGAGGPVAPGPFFLPGPGYGFGLGFAVRLADGINPTIGTKGDAHWAGIAGTGFWIDPEQKIVAVIMVQAPRHRFYNRTVLRNFVYGAVVK